MKKQPHNRKFNAEELFDRRYEVSARKEAEYIEELMDMDEARVTKDPLLSQAPAIIQEELSRFNDWAARQEDPRLTIVKMMRERKE